MELLALIVMPCVTLAVIFDEDIQGHTDISQLSIGANVDTIHLHDNNLGVSGIPADFFEGLPLVHTIWLMNNNLDDLDIPDFCFDGVGDSLLDLSLGNNHLTEIRKDQFKGLHVLEQLKLHANDIHTIQIGEHSSMGLVA